VKRFGVADCARSRIEETRGRATGCSTRLSGPLRETNWKRSVRWSAAIAAIGRPQLRVHDLRQTAASMWLGSGADPKIVQRVLGHASAAMTMDPVRPIEGPRLGVDGSSLGQAPSKERDE
jgi:integrase